MSPLFLALSAQAAPWVEDEPLDALAACREHAGPEREIGAVPPSSRVALVVGVPCHDDPSIPSLQFSSRDAEAVGEALTARGYTVQALTTHVPRQAFLDGLDRVAGALPDDGELVLYFSGHGVLRETARGLERFLVFSDTDLSDIEATGLSLTTLEERVQRIEVRRRLVVQDSCYAAGEGAKGLGTPAGVKTLGLPGPSLQAPDTRLYASRFYELATEDLDLQGSVYTRTLLEAMQDAPDLDGDGCVGLLEAHVEAAERTERRRDGYQHPEWAGAFVNDACSGTAQRAVVLEEGAIRSVEPGRIADVRVPAGAWVELRPTRPWHLQVGSWAAARRWEVAAAAFGGELVVTWRGPVVWLAGVRGAWALPSERNGVQLRGGEGLVRLGLMSRTPVKVGPVVELGVLGVDPKGPSLPLQTAPLAGTQLRGQLDLGRLYVALEGGLGYTLERSQGRTRVAIVPMLAGGFGLRL